MCVRWISYVSIDYRTYKDIIPHSANRLGFIVKNALNSYKGKPGTMWVSWVLVEEEVVEEDVFFGCRRRKYVGGRSS